MPRMARRSRRHESSNVEIGPAPRGTDTPAEEGPSRSARKRESDELQALGEQAATLPSGTLASLSLPERLADALAEAKRLKSFGARRRQAQFLGKLMRRLDADTLEAVRAAVTAAHAPAAEQTALLHRAERIRDALLDSDAELERWISEAPDPDGPDATRLRALIREARSDAHAARPGEAPRRGRAYREIFALVRARLERV
jgi:ribosome-associated protein